MATYPVYNKVTGEQKEVVLSVHDWEKWKEDNSEWDRDWSDPATCPATRCRQDRGYRHPSGCQFRRRRGQPQKNDPLNSMHQLRL